MPGDLLDGQLPVVFLGLFVIAGGMVWSFLVGIAGKR
jgi:hypothetical protein